MQLWSITETINLPLSTCFDTMRPLCLRLCPETRAGVRTHASRITRALGAADGAENSPRAGAMAATATTLVHHATPDFPIQHSFTNGGNNPWRNEVRVPMRSILPLLNTCPRLMLCGFRVVSTRLLIPDFDVNVRRLLDIAGSKPRTFKYAEGLINLTLKEACVLPAKTRLLAVTRRCTCGAVQWTETVSVQDLRDRTTCLHFKSSFTVHTSACVPLNTTVRPGQLIGAYVLVKELSACRTTTTSDIERGGANFDRSAHDMTMVSDLVPHGEKMSRSFIRQTLGHSRETGRGTGNERKYSFQLIHEMAVAMKEKARRHGDFSRMNVVEYHPVRDTEATDCADPNAWWYYIVEMPYATRDMSTHGGDGIAYDGKVKLVLEGGVVIPIMTTRKGLAHIRDPVSNTRVPLHGLRYQHRGDPNYILVANSENSGLLTLALSAVRGLLRCEDVHCDHTVALHEGVQGGFTLAREGCANNDRPGEWSVEQYDACSAYLKSTYHRSYYGGWDHLSVPIICRYHNIVCQMDWLCKHGLSTNPVALDRGDKVFRYLLASRSREDLDRRLEIFERVCLPYIFDDEADQEEYLNYLLTTRFAPVGHRAFLRDDRRARSHCAYGQYDSPDTSMFNMVRQKRRMH